MSEPANKGATPVKPATDVIADKLRALHVARAREELSSADALAPGSDRVAWRGALLAEVAVVKGLPGPAEATGGSALSGADGQAVSKALEALGWAPDTIFFTLSRPEPGTDAASRADRLRLQLEAVDPRAIVALDLDAAADIAEAFGCEPLVPGVALRVLGRQLVAVDGFEDALRDEKRKQVVWAQLKAARTEGPVY